MIKPKGQLVSYDETTIGDKIILKSRGGKNLKMTVIHKEKEMFCFVLWVVSDDQPKSLADCLAFRYSDKKQIFKLSVGKVKEN